MIDIFQYDFVQRAFIVGLLASIIAPLIGIFLVLRRLSNMADTLAHVSLLGIAAGIVSGLNPIISAIVVSVVSSLGIERLRHQKRIAGDTALALFLSGSLALAIVLISLKKGYSVDLLSFLFGSITTVTNSDLLTMVILSAVLLVIMYSFYKEFFLVSFDEEIAKAEGLKTTFLNLFMAMLAAVVVVLSIRIVGVLLIGALMIIPVTTALQFHCSFKRTVWLSMLFSFLATIIGLFISYYADVASGGTIVVVALVFFSLSLLFNWRD